MNNVLSLNSIHQYMEALHALYEVGTESLSIIYLDFRLQMYTMMSVSM
jgi:hypothetical protein